MRADDFVCPVCGEVVPARAAACPECGADEQTGWSDQTQYDGLGLDDPEEFDYDAVLEREFGWRRRRTALEWLWVVTAAVVVGLLAWFLLLAA